MLCPVGRCFALLLLCHGVGGGFPLELLGHRLCLAWVLPQGWAALGLASLGLNSCFLWEEKKAEQAPLDGVWGEFLYVSCSVIVLGTVHCVKTLFPSPEFQHYTV